MFTYIKFNSVYNDVNWYIFYYFKSDLDSWNLKALSFSLISLYNGLLKTKITFKNILKYHQYHYSSSRNPPFAIQKLISLFGDQDSSYYEVQYHHHLRIDDDQNHLLYCLNQAKSIKYYWIDYSIHYQIKLLH